MMNKMMGFVNKLQGFLMPIANAMHRNKYMKAIRNGCVLSLPFIMVGSILTSLASMPFLENVFGETLLGQIQDFLAPSSTMSSSILAVFIVIGIAYQLSKEYELNPLHGAMTSLVMFLILCPTSAASGETVIKNVIGLDYIGSRAMATGIIVAIIGVELYNWAIKHKLRIKMPDSVPQAISDSFTSFIPAGICMIFALVVRQLFLMTAQGTLTDFIYYWVQRPLNGIALSFPSMLLYGLLVNLFWFFGMHGQSMVGSVFKPFLIAANAENLEALAAGTALPNIFTQTFARAFVIFGYWISIPLLLALYLYAKKHQRADWKQVMKISLIPGLFNIYEPLMFGLPLVLNPFALIPMLLTPVITCTSFYLLTLVGVVPVTTGITVPSTTPIGLAGILSTNSISGGVVSLLLVIPLTALWYFFLYIQDKSERETGVYTDKTIEDKE